MNNQARNGTSAVSYTAKKTRHKYRELYRVTFNDGIKKTIGKHNGNWHLYITDNIYNMRAFGDMDSAARYAHEMAVKENAWAKTALIKI